MENTSNFSFSYNIFNNYIFLVRQNVVLFGNGLKGNNSIKAKCTATKCNIHLYEAIIFIYSFILSLSVKF